MQKKQNPHTPNHSNHVFIYLIVFHFFQFQRRNRVYKEEQRQLRAAAEKAKGGGGGADGHHWESLSPSLVQWVCKRDDRSNWFSSTFFFKIKSEAVVFMCCGMLNTKDILHVEDFEFYCNNNEMYVLLDMDACNLPPALINCFVCSLWESFTCFNIWLWILSPCSESTKL